MPMTALDAVCSEVFTVYREILEGFAAEKIGVFGESAGGGLAAALAVALRDAGEA
jgi:acetyl esterase/lipase